MGDGIEAFRDGLRNATGPAADGVLLQHPSVAMVEHLAAAPEVDFLLFDLQHGCVSTATLEACLAVAHHVDTPTLARLSGPDTREITRAIDGGVVGVILPMVEEPTTLADVGRALRFPPAGHRSYSSTSRAIGRWPPPDPLLIAMIESRRGVENVERLVDVAALDGLYVGPADLSLSFHAGTSPRSTPTTQNAIASILEAARIHGVAVGMHRPDQETAAQCRFRTLAGDLELLTHGLRAVSGGAR